MQRNPYARQQSTQHYSGQSGSQDLDYLRHQSPQIYIKYGKFQVVRGKIPDPVVVVKQPKPIMQSNSIQGTDSRNQQFSISRNSSREKTEQNMSVAKILRYESPQKKSCSFLRNSRYISRHEQPDSSSTRCTSSSPGLDLFNDLSVQSQAQARSEKVFTEELDQRIKEKELHIINLMKIKQEQDSKLQMIISLKEEEIQMLRNSFREKEKEYIEQINNLSKRSNMLQQKKQQLQSQCKYMSDENHSLDGQVRKLRDDLQKYEQLNLNYEERYNVKDKQLQKYIDKDKQSQFKIQELAQGVKKLTQQLGLKVEDVYNLNHRIEQLTELNTKLREEQDKSKESSVIQNSLQQLSSNLDNQTKNLQASLNQVKIYSQESLIKTEQLLKQQLSINEELVQEKKQLEKESQRLARLIQDEKAVSTKLSSDKRDLQEKCKQLQAHLQQIDKEPKVFSGARTSESEIKAKDNEIKVLTFKLQESDRKVQQYAARIEDQKQTPILENDNHQFVKTQETMDEQAQHYDTQLQQIQLRQNKETQQLHQTVNSLRTQLEQAQKQLVERDRQIQQSKSTSTLEMHRSQQQINELQLEVSSLTDLCQQYEDRNQQLASLLKTKEQENHRLNDTMNSYDSKMRSAMEEIRTQSKSQLNQLNLEKEQIAQRHLAKLDQQNILIQNLNSTNEELSEEVQDLKEKLTTVVEEHSNDRNLINELQQQLGEKQDQLTKQQSEYIASMASLQEHKKNELRQSSTIIDRLQQTIQQQSEQIQDLSSKAKDESKKNQAKVTTLEATINTQQIEFKEQEQKIALLIEEIRNSQIKEEKLDDERAKDEQLSQSEAQVLRLQEDTQGKDMLISSLRKQVEHLENENKQIPELKDHLKEFLSLNDTQGREHQIAIAKFEERLEKLQTKLQASTQLVETQAGTMNQYCSQLEAARLELEHSQSQINIFKGQFQVANQAAFEQKQELELLQTKIRIQEQISRQHEEKTNNAQTLSASLSDQLNDSRQQLELAKIQHSSLHEQFLQVQQGFESANAALLAVKIELQDKTNQLTDSESSATQQISKLKERIQSQDDNLLVLLNDKEREANKTQIIIAQNEEKLQEIVEEMNKFKHSQQIRLQETTNNVQALLQMKDASDQKHQIDIAIAEETITDLREQIALQSLEHSSQITILQSEQQNSQQKITVLTEALDSRQQSLLLMVREKEEQANKLQILIAQHEEAISDFNELFKQERNVNSTLVKDLNAKVNQLLQLKESTDQKHQMDLALGEEAAQLIRDQYNETVAKLKKEINELGLQLNHQSQLHSQQQREYAHHLEEKDHQMINMQAQLRKLAEGDKQTQIDMVTNYEKQIAELQDLLSQKETQFMEMSNETLGKIDQIQDLSHQIESQSTQISNLQQNKQLLADNCHNLEHTLQIVEQKLQASEKANQEQQLRISQLNLELDKLQEQTKEQKAYIKQLLQQKELGDSKFQVANAKNEENLFELTQELNELQIKHQNATSYYDRQIKNLLQLKEDEDRKHQIGLAISEEKLQDSQEKNIELARVNLELVDQIGNLHQQISQQKETNNASTETSEQQILRLNRLLEEQYSIVKKHEEDQTITCEGHDLIISEMKDNITQRNQKISELEATLLQVEKANNELKSSVEDKIINLTSQVDEGQQAISKLELELSRAIQTVEQLKTQLKERDAYIRELVNDRENSDGKVQLQIAQKEELIEELQNQLKVLRLKHQGEIIGAQAQIKQLLQIREESDRKYQIDMALAEELRQDLIGQHEESSKQQGSALSLLMSKANLLQIEKKELEHAKAGLESELDRIELSNRQLQQELENLNQKVKQQDIIIQQLQQKVDRLSSQNSDMRESHLQAEIKAKQLQSTVQELEYLINEKTQEIVALQEQVNALFSENERLKLGQISDLQNQDESAANPLDQGFSMADDVSDSDPNQQPEGFVNQEFHLNQEGNQPSQIRLDELDPEGGAELDLQLKDLEIEDLKERVVQLEHLLEANELANQFQHKTIANLKDQVNTLQLENSDHSNPQMQNEWLQVQELSKQKNAHILELFQKVFDQEPFEEYSLYIQFTGFERQQRQRLEEILKRTGELVKANQNTDERLLKLESENTRLHDELNHISRRRNQLQTEIKTHQDDISSLTRKNIDLRSQLEESSQKSYSERESPFKLNESSTIKKQISQTEVEDMSLSRNDIRLDEQGANPNQLIQKLTTELITLRKANSSLEKQVSNQDEQEDTLQSQLSLMKKEMNGYRDRMLMLDKELKDRLNASEGAAIWQHMNSLLIKFFDAFLSDNRQDTRVYLDSLLSMIGKDQKYKTNLQNKISDMQQKAKKSQSPGIFGLFKQ